MADRQFVKVKFRPRDAKSYTYHWDELSPLALGDEVRVPDRSGDGWSRARRPRMVRGYGRMTEASPATPASHTPDQALAELRGLMERAMATGAPGRMPDDSCIAACIELDNWQAYLPALLTRIEALEAALRPFVEEAAKNPDYYLDGDASSTPFPNTDLKVGDWALARDTLAEKET